MGAKEAQLRVTQGKGEFNMGELDRYLGSGNMPPGWSQRPRSFRRRMQESREEAMLAAMQVHDTGVVAMLAQNQLVEVDGNRLRHWQDGNDLLNQGLAALELGYINTATSIVASLGSRF